MKTQIQTQQIYYTGLSTERADYAGYDDVIFHETDTGKDYTYDKATQAWVEIEEEPAGGGDVMVVPVTVDISSGTPVYSTNVAIADVAEACADGKGVMYVLNIDVPNVAFFSLHSISVVMSMAEGSATAMITMPESGEFPTTYYHTADGFSDQAPNVGG